MRFGPLSLRSTFALRNIGVDTNVFNEADTATPQSDFTMTFTPTTNLWFRMGRTWITGLVNVDWVYYRRFVSERSANSTYQVGVARTFNRLSLGGAVRRLSTRERPGFEIDARSQRLEVEWNGNVEMRTLGKTFVGVRTSRRGVEFDRFAMFRETNLAQELNRTTTARAVFVRYAMTPLTTVLVEVGREHDRFVFSPFRDADSTRVTGTASFQPLALLNGSATVGYRHFTPLVTDVPPFRGATTAMALSYSLLGTTRFGVEANRDVQPSFEFEHPYYVDTGLTLSVQQQVFGPFDLLGRVTTRRLAYRNRLGVRLEVANRTDRVGGFGIGGGYRLGTDKRVGFLIERQNRRSNLDENQFAGVRFGMSLTYER